jgi:hypothetical protein
MDLDAMSGNCSEWLLWAWMTDEAISEANFLERGLQGTYLRVSEILAEIFSQGVTDVSRSGFPRPKKAGRVSITRSSFETCGAGSQCFSSMPHARKMGRKCRARQFGARFTSAPF